MRPTRRLLTAAGLALTLGLGLTGAAGSAVGPADMSLGRSDAKVTVIEYASVTCSHCADWHATVWPAFKARYVDTGKVRFVLRELTTEPVAWSNGGFLVARCAGKANYFKVIDALFDGQAKLFETGDYAAWLAAAGAAGGLSAAEAEACTLSEPGLNALYARMEASQREHDVNSTPTLFVNDRKTGASLAELEAAIEPLLRRRR